MTDVPVLGFAAYSGVGKTTLIEQVVVRLKESGLRVAVLKHDAHSVVLDHEGKDSWRFTKAGADISIVCSQERTAMVEQRPITFKKLLELVHDVDIVLVEGFKNEAIPQIGIDRKATGKGFPSPLSRYVAIVTDDEKLNSSVPKFTFGEVDAITDFILENMKNFKHINN